MSVQIKFNNCCCLQTLVLPTLNDDGECQLFNVKKWPHHYINKASTINKFKEREGGEKEGERERDRERVRGMGKNNFCQTKLSTWRRKSSKSLACCEWKLVMPASAVRQAVQSVDTDWNQSPTASAIIDLSADMSSALQAASISSSISCSSTSSNSSRASGARWWLAQPGRKGTDKTQKGRNSRREKAKPTKHARWRRRNRNKMVV